MCSLLRDLPLHLLPILTNYHSHRATCELLIDNSFITKQNNSPTHLNTPPTKYEKLENREKSHISIFTQLNQIL